MQRFVQIIIAAFLCFNHFVVISNPLPGKQSRRRGKTQADRTGGDINHGNAFLRSKLACEDSNTPSLPLIYKQLPFSQSPSEPNSLVLEFCFQSPIEDYKKALNQNSRLWMAYLVQLPDLKVLVKLNEFETSEEFGCFNGRFDEVHLTPGENYQWVLYMMGERAFEIRSPIFKAKTLTKKEIYTNGFGLIESSVFLSEQNAKEFYDNFNRAFKSISLEPIGILSDKRFKVLLKNHNNLHLFTVHLNNGNMADVIYPDGKTYHGELHAFCQKEENSVEYMEGFGLNNKSAHGFGLLLFPKDVPFIYEGAFRDSKMDIFGRFHQISGQEYEGQHRRGLFGSIGKLKYPDGSGYYGQFQNGAPSGPGRIRHTIFNEWLECDSCVPGIFHNKDGSITEGYRVDGVFFSPQLVDPRVMAFKSSGGRVVSDLLDSPENRLLYEKYMRKINI